MHIVKKKNIKWHFTVYLWDKSYMRYEQERQMPLIM